MDLIRDDQDPMLDTEAAQPQQLLAGPDPTHRVVRAAEDEEFGLPQLLLQVREVDRVPLSVEAEPVI